MYTYELKHLCYDCFQCVVFLFIFAIEKSFCAHTYTQTHTHAIHFLSLTPPALNYKCKVVQQLLDKIKAAVHQEVHLVLVLLAVSWAAFLWLSETWQIATEMVKLIKILITLANILCSQITHSTAYRNIYICYIYGWFILYLIQWLT